MSAIISILIPILQALLPSLIKAFKPSSEDGARVPELRERLRRQVRGTWGRTALPILLLAVLSACTTHSVYVPDGTPVRLRETVELAKVWILDAEGIPIASTMDLPEGWYVLPLADEERDTEPD